MEGYIQLHRKILEWEWYEEPKTFAVFLHCLLKANWKEKNWRGNTIPRGSFITSLDSLKNETHLSLQSIRTAISKLERTGEITKESHTSFTIIKVNKYEEYQGNNKQTTDEQQTSNKQATTTNKDNNSNKEIYISILNHWNSKGITNHKKITNDIDLQIRMRLEEYSFDDIIKSIDIYSEIFLSDKTFFKYKWSLSEFLQRKNGMRVFLYKTIEDYLIDKNVPGGKKDSGAVKTVEEFREGL